MDELTSEQEEAVAATVGAMRYRKKNGRRTMPLSEGISKRRSRNSASEVSWHMRG